MIRHLLTFNFRSTATESERRELLEELSTFPARYPTMRNWTLGRNVSRRDDTYEWAFVVDFDTEDDLIAYLDSDSHERFVAERWRPLVAERAIVSFNTTETDPPAEGPLCHA